MRKYFEVPKRVPMLTLLGLIFPLSNICRSYLTKIPGHSPVVRTRFRQAMSKLAFMVAILSLVNCTNQEEFLGETPAEISIESSVNAETKGNFETFAIYGEIHNKLLQHVATNFSEPQIVPTTKNEIVDYVLAIQREGIEKLSISENDKTILSECLGSYKKFYVTADLMGIVRPNLSQASLIEDDGEKDLTTKDVRRLIRDAHETGGIDSFEYQLFMKLIDYVLANADGSLSNNDFKLKVNDLIAQWKVKYSDVDFSKLKIQRNGNGSPLVGIFPIKFKDAPKGALGGVVLNVSKSSLDYWTGKQSSIQDIVIPAFVGADIAGVIVGACSSGIGSYVMSGSVDWKSVVWGAASCGIIGSTGIIGKVGKWISKGLSTII